MIKNIINFLKLPAKVKLVNRLSRTQFLKFQIVILSMAIMYGTLILFAQWLLSTFMPDKYQWIGCLVYIPMYCVLLLFYFGFNLCSIVSRLHDLNFSGGWAWVLFVGFLRIILFFVLLFCPGSKDENKYGKTSEKIWVPINFSEDYLV